MTNSSSTSTTNVSATTSLRFLQWNILAAGLGQDGFLSTEFAPIYPNPDKETELCFGAAEFLDLVRNAKENDEKNGVITAMEKLKKAKGASEDEIAEWKQQVASSNLVGLKNQFATSPQLQRVEDEILDWDVRYERIKKIVLAANPDIITFQELDKTKQFLDDEEFASQYTNLIDPDRKQQYSPARYPSLSSKSTTEEQSSGDDEDDLRPDNYLQHLLDAGVAFAPKSYSNAYKYRSKNDPNKHENELLEDDGVAIFWKKERYTPIELAFLKYPTTTGFWSNAAVVAVVLLDITTQEKINVITTHLASGNKPSLEKKRLASLKDPYNNKVWIAKRLVRDSTKTSSSTVVWKEDDKFGSSEQQQSFDGIISFVKHYTERLDSSRTIFALDANSRPLFPLVEFGARADVYYSTNVWNELKKTGLSSIWVLGKYLQEDGTINDEYKDTPIIASVNKMRGPSSDQPAKIGEHQLELIDHVFTDAHNQISLVESIVVEEGKTTVQAAPLLYSSVVCKAELDLIPSLSMPSDHLPVIVDIQYTTSEDK